MRYPLDKRLAESNRALLEASKAGKVLVSMSAGMDSVCMADLVVKSGVECELVHLYLVKDLPCDTVVLDEMEKRWGRKIHRIPHPTRNLQVWQRSLSTAGSTGLIEGTDPYAGRIPAYSWDTFNKDLAAHFGCHYVAVGYLRSDGPRRCEAMSVNPRPGNRKVYPLSLWTYNDVKDYHKEHEIPISPTYKLLDCSYDHLGLCHSYPLKHGHPTSWEAIIRDFPYIGYAAELYEARVRRGDIPPTVKGKIVW